MINQEIRDNIFVIVKVEGQLATLHVLLVVWLPNLRGDAHRLVAEICPVQQRGAPTSCSREKRQAVQCVIYE